LTARPPVDLAAREAFKAVQDRARADHGGNTQQLLVVYAVESFLRRLSISDHAHQMILKGGMLMAASRIRQMTKDADLSTHGIAGDDERVREIVDQICALTPDPHDGIRVDPATIRTEIMREQDEYKGVRCKVVATLGQARIPFALDFSFGDLDQSTEIELASVIDREAVRLAAYRRCSGARPAPGIAISPISGLPVAYIASTRKNSGSMSSPWPRTAASA